MARLPPDVTRAYIAEELPGARAWADRRGLELVYDVEKPSLRVKLRGSEEAGPVEAYLLEGQLDDYRVHPPLWHFLDPRNGEDIGIAAFPAPSAERIPGINASIFLRYEERGVICARFNRAAYLRGVGPHPEWGDLTGWEQAVDGQACATTLGDMLHRIDLEVCASTSRMEPLP